VSRSGSSEPGGGGESLRAFWTARLAGALLASCPDGQLVELAEGRDAPLFASSSDRRAWLEAHSCCDAGLQAAIMHRWRELYGELVAAAEITPIDGSAEQCAAILRQFAPEMILLELITSERDDGWRLAEWVVDNVKLEAVRRDLSDILVRWSAPEAAVPEPVPPAPAKVRLVIFGGHIRDEGKMARRLFEHSPFEVRWKPFETNLGNPDARDLEEAMATADAVLLISTMVSHNIMHMVKRYAKKKQIPLRTITKATDMQLTAALAELFPHLPLVSGG
jgi:hypothetical protein